MLSNEQVLSIANDMLRLDEFLVRTLHDTRGTKWLESFANTLSVDGLADIALMMHTGELYCDLSYDDYLVLDTDDRDVKLEEYAESYYSNIVDPQIPENLRGYMNQEYWIEDFLNNYDAGEALASDGVEHTYNVLNTEFYIYAT